MEASMSEAYVAETISRHRRPTPEQPHRLGELSLEAEAGSNRDPPMS